jgi:hypothetical protein
MEPGVKRARPTQCMHSCWLLTILKILFVFHLHSLEINMLRSTRHFIPAHKIRGSIATQLSFLSSESESSKADKGSKDRVSTEDIVHLVAEAHHLSLAETRRILTTTFDAIVDVSLKKNSL